MSDLLQLDQVTICFGGLTAVGGVSLSIGEGELVGLIGPNGAGKTTVFNLVTGIYQPTSGVIRVAGRPTTGLKPFQITELGVARTFQNIRLFPSLSVFDNVRVACHLHLAQGAAHSLVRLQKFQREEREISGRVEELLDVFELGSHRAAPAKSLPYGDQRRLEILRALATRPRLLLLDEPAAGMNPTEKADLMRLIVFIRDRFQVAVLVVEHDMRFVMGICERIHVLEHGVKIAGGTPHEIRANPKVIEAYLGEEPGC